MRQVTFQARNNRHAKAIVRKLTEVTQAAQKELARHEEFWGKSSSADMDAKRIEALEEMWQMDSDEEEHADANSFRIFLVKQVHLQEYRDPATPDKAERVPETVLMRIGHGAVDLVLKDTGFVVQTLDWSELVLWRSDGGSLVLVLSTSNRQITLLSDVADEISGCLTQTAYAILHNADKTKLDTVEHRGQELPKHAFMYRHKLMKFEPLRVEVNDAWKEAGHSKLKQVSMAMFGDKAMQESMQTRQQLKAIVSVVDPEGLGSLDVAQLGELMTHLKIQSPQTGRPLSKQELEEIMVDMEAFHGEVTFDDFVAWTLRTTAGASAGEVLRVRVAHRKKEVAAVEALFDKVRVLETTVPLSP